MRVVIIVFDSANVAIYFWWHLCQISADLDNFAPFNKD